MLEDDRLGGDAVLTQLEQLDQRGTLCVIERAQHGLAHSLAALHIRESTHAYRRHVTVELVGDFKLDVGAVRRENVHNAIGVLFQNVPWLIGLYERDQERRQLTAHGSSGPRSTTWEAALSFRIVLCIRRAKEPYSCTCSARCCTRYDLRSLQYRC